MPPLSSPSPKKLLQKTAYAAAASSSQSPSSPSSSPLLASSASFTPPASPSSATAARAARDDVWQSGEAPFGTPADDMAGLGLGLQLYFSLLDDLSRLFLLLTVLNVPHLLANFSGEGIAPVDGDSAGFSVFTMGNRGGSCPTTEKAGTCDEQDEQVLGLTLSNTLVSATITACSCLSFLLLLRFSHSTTSNRINKYRTTRDRTAPSAARYAVQVRGFPGDVAEEEVEEFFNSRYDLSKRQKAFGAGGVSEEGVRRGGFW